MFIYQKTSLKNNFLKLLNNYSVLLLTIVNFLIFTQISTNFTLASNIKTTRSANKNNNKKEEKVASNQTPISQILWQGINKKDVEILKKIVILLDKKNHQQALDLIRNNTNFLVNNSTEEQNLVKNRPNLREALLNIISWQQFSNKDNINKINFNEISDFVSENPFYHNIDEVKRNAEKIALIKDLPYQKAEKYFKINPATTKESKLYLLQSEISFFNNFHGSTAEKSRLYQQIRDLIGEVWIKENFTEGEESRFIEKFKKHITIKDCIERINRLLWDDKTEEAKRIIYLVDQDHQKLFNAVLELSKMPSNTKDILDQVPSKLSNNEILTHRRIIWHKNNNQIDEILSLMKNLPENSKFGQKWWNLRKLYGREMLKNRRYKIAYSLIANHNLATSSPDFWEAEWTAGWLALRFVRNNNQAYSHFDKLYKAVSQPVTLARAAYWLGMTSEAKGDKKQAIHWYKTAAKYPIFFYGQLAIHKHRKLDKTGAKHDIILPKDPDIYLSDLTATANSKTLQIAYLLALIGDKNSATKIFEWTVQNAKTDGQIAVIMRIINEIGDRTIDAKVARAASKRNVLFVRDKFQIVNEVENDQYAPLIHAIIKQESAFLPSAVSKVGAIGYMQLMPETAKITAKEMGISYDRRKLAGDIDYNVKLGSFYIKKLLNKFEGSEILAVASYNAGPGATQRWINEFYDPRIENDIDKVVDWIELITYTETRNYVQRIMENLIVYKYLMSRSNYDDIR
jgi:soluble lytic murein transglycosylase